jgi:hypothetical protein
MAMPEPLGDPAQLQERLHEATAVALRPWL